MNVYQIVRIKIKDTSITEPEIKLAVDEVEEVIKNYCNIDAVPNELKYTHANMAVDLVHYTYHSNNKVESELSSEDISSLKIGDTNITLGGNSSGERGKALKSHRPNLDQITMNYKQQLNQFRRMVW